VDRNQAEELSRSADRITEAVRELTWTLNRFLEYQQTGRVRGETLLSFLGAGGINDQKAIGLAQALKHHGPETSLLVTEDRDPSPDQVRKRREVRRAREQEERR
jgi:hypothetical protein